MRVHVKICGIRDASAALVAVEAGADALGFVMSESVRRVTSAEASAIAARLPESVEKVAVFRRPRPEELAAALGTLGTWLVQADHDAVGDASGVRLLPVYREAPGVEAAIEADLARRGATRFHYEGPDSGAGETVDWLRAHRLSRLSGMTLAGGLTPDNVGEAIRLVRPFGVDVSSGVESRPGIKDPGLIREFVAAVRATERGAV
ncbi:MAG: phosphoribosylanthranilate isomerase [Acidimicrobiia bacterium]